VRPDSIEGGRTIVNKWYALDSYGLFLEDGDFIFKVAFPDGGWGRQVWARVPAAAGVWTHVAGVFDGTSGVIKIYVNGVLGATVETGASELQESDRALVIGNHPEWNSYQGLIDDVRLYDQPLSDAQLQRLAGMATIN
jgi:hypothetical protein